MGALLDLAFAALDESETTPSKAELRRQRVLSMLNANSELEYALISDIDSDPDSVLLTLGMRGKATCELEIPRAKYDGVLLLELLKRHGGTVH